MITEYITTEPTVILCNERYDYYKECERKAKLAEKEIHRLATEQFKEWSENTNFTVDLKNRFLAGAIRTGSTFTTQWIEDTWYNDDMLKDPTFSFEKSLNDSICHIADTIYAEHLKELRDEYVSKYSKRQKSYVRMRTILFFSLIINIFLVAGFIACACFSKIFING